MSDQPMRCGDAAPYLSAFSDGELEESLRGRVGAHVAECAQCEAELRRYAAITDLVGTLPRSAPSPEVLDRVLAAVRPAASSLVTRESLLRRPKLLAPRSLPPLLRASTGSPTVVRTVAGRSRRPPTVAARMIPVLAAALLIAFSVFALSRFPLVDRLRGSRPVATPQPVMSVLAETQRQASAERATLGFSPVVPTYLPPGAALQHVSVGAEPADPALHYLDMTWTLTFPLTTLHVRESPLPLDKRGDFISGGYSDPALTWSLGPFRWIPGLVQGAAARCAVGETRPSLSISVDVASQGNSSACDTTNFAEINVLRLASLALDAPYAPLTVRAPDGARAVLHFRAYKTVPSGYSWDVYVDPVHQRTSITVSDPGGAKLYTDLIANGSVTRINLEAKRYQTLCGCQADNEPQQLAASVVTFFATANTLLGSGALWNMGLTDVSGEMVGVARAYKLVLVSAPYPTTLYVDLSTKQILGAQVDYQSAAHPGGAGASSRLTPSVACPSYSQIQYQLPSAVPASTFTFTPTAGYTQGAVNVTPVTC